MRVIINSRTARINSNKIFVNWFEIFYFSSQSIIKFNSHNLIKKFDIYSTRSEFFKHENRFADYVLASKDIKVNNFQVLPETVSDHLSLCLDFDVD